MMSAGKQNNLDQFLNDVRLVMAESLSQTVLQKLVEEKKSLLNSGKMLRSRLCYRVGLPAGVPYKTLLHAGAAVEMIHSASLLHDDVIDGGHIRRGAPTFWVKRGIPGAILVGDLMLFKALDVVGQVEEGRLTRQLIKVTGEVCDAESEQELLLRGSSPEWSDCIKIARRKTGALFAFSAYACGNNDPTLSDTLLESGYQIGTAYQLADDILDATGSREDSDKSLGSDEHRNKPTAAKFNPAEAIACVHDLSGQALESLRPWPTVYKAWSEFMETDIKPVLNSFTASAT
ncbi:MAG: polyprenyl synthetase family protein [Verrucomicrobia bacterium]|nr:polyprenyl synthetase family protein [Kiritimatiellia bacterium]MCP5488303.1 polyprenyl synthetase family protein [Verrucomicrobiota bacterium]